ncbi:hypothetical protein N7462_004692 [Penicillium macrosclerotiorum]|uniref:uncharacterized protein n=1 Tax=Penicillium macrosclerotiorum TaxID=303699 RepID=UPI0025475115|nr:uncharacterized protein N7462_004692 [Penicillium macrosclerotiorum]KAJ5690300.1 hypothetical protein N7462_004692 [Penicillium macrosclerotiorum]
MVSRLLCIIAGVLALGSGLVNAHGSHSNDQPPSDDWATRHMIGTSHRILRCALFFTLHDYDSSGAWTPDEVRKTYGIDDESNKGVSESRKESAVRAVFDLFDPQNTGFIKRDAWLKAVAAGTRLPDLGFGPGHHGDIEYEYEIHHFEKYHGEDATEEELTHPEDIEHFRQHDAMEAAQKRLDMLEAMQVVDANIPSKFRRNV